MLHIALVVSRGLNERTSTPTRMSIMTCTVFNWCDIGHADGHGNVGLFGC